LGIDPLREEAKKNKILNAVFALLYMAKIFLTGFTMKGDSCPSKFRCHHGWYVSTNHTNVALPLQCFSSVSWPVVAPSMLCRGWLCPRQRLGTPLLVRKKEMQRTQPPYT
jgi:hypothetical protein